MTALLAELPVPRCVLFVLLALLASPPGWAAESVERLYETVVRIADRTAATRQQAVRDGFAQVLVRLTGYSRVAQLAGVAGELARAQTYLLESSVERAPVVAADRLGTEQGDLLWVRFNRALVDALVERLELPVWPALRPSLVYVAVSDHWGVPAIPTTAEHPALWLRLQSLFAGRSLGGYRRRICGIWMRGVCGDCGGCVSGLGWIFWHWCALSGWRAGRESIFCFWRRTVRPCGVLGCIRICWPVWRRG